MAVERIEHYKQANGVDILKVILKPTKKFQSGGYFYAPAEAVNLVEKYTWRLHAYGHRVCVRARVNGSDYYEAGRRHQDTVLFHTKLFEFYNNFKWQADIDHRDLVEYDNTDQNLEPVTRQQNQLNHFTRGYVIDNQYKPARFETQIMIDGNLYYPYSTVRNEADACSVQNYTEQVWLRDKLGSKYYMFDFKKYRRGSEDILDLERTGQISEEEATCKHILRYSDNAWYYLRYGLEQYFKDNRIPIPKYSLDEYGFMRHPVTNQLLCPFH